MRTIWAAFGITAVAVFMALSMPSAVAAQECSKCDEDDAALFGGSGGCVPDGGASGWVCRIGASGKCSNWSSTCVPIETFLRQPRFADPVHNAVAVALHALPAELLDAIRTRCVHDPEVRRVLSDQALEKETSTRVSQ